MNSPNAQERLREAVHILTSEEGSLKHRLMLAYISQLFEIDPQRDLPQKLQEPFQRLRVVLTQDEVVGDTGTVSRELERISDEDAQEIARRIFEMYLAVSHEESKDKQAKAQ